LIPVLLNSACKLENGLLRYQQATDGSATSTLDGTYKAKLSPTMNPQFLPLLSVCNDCAKVILQTAKANQEFRRMNFLDSLNMDCQKWLRSKIAALQ
jgi:hypothetical protein